MKRIPAALALGGLLLAGGAFAAPPNAYQGTPEKENEAVKASQKTGQPSKSAKPEEKKGGMTAETFAGLELRNIGPAVVGGRIVDLAVDPALRRAPGTSRWPPAACGRPPTPAPPGRPIFDGQGSYSIGCVTIDPKNPLVRLGRHRREQQPAQRRLRRRRLQVDRRRQELGERRAQEVRAHRQDRDRSRATRTSSTSRPRGRSGRPGGDRGLYKTTDGGKTWKPVLDDQREHRRHRRRARPAQPGRALRRGLPAAPARLDADQRRPRGGHPQVHRRRRDLEEGRAAACPTADMGRIGLAIAPSQPDMVYAIVEAAEQGRRLLPLHRRRRQLGEAQRPRRPAARSTTRRSSSIPRTPTASTRWTCSSRSRDDGGKTLPATWARRTSTSTTTRSGSTRRTATTCWWAATAASTRRFDRGANWRLPRQPADHAVLPA